MALYEHVVVTRPDISPQQVDALVEDITKIVTERKGKIGKTEYWGLRNLAYPIKKSRKAHYSLLNIDAPGDADPRARAPSPHQRGRAALPHREGR